MKNYILEYWEKIESGEIIVCSKIRQQYAMLVDDLHNPKDPYVFDIKLATKPIEFIETFCFMSQGKNRGKPLILELFQKAKFQAMFGFVHKDTRLRQYTEVLTIEGRKNGKTTENAALAAFMLVADGEGAAECYFVATKKEQANIAFDEVRRMVNQNPELNAHIRKRQTDLYFDATQSKIQALASDAKSMDGLNSHFITLDEMSEIKNRNVYDVMKQSISSRDQPVLSCITTNGYVRNGVFDDQYAYASSVLDGKIEDKSLLAFIYELDHRDEWQDEDMCVKANPGLDTIKKRRFLKDLANKAKTSEPSKIALLVKDFNNFESDSASWLSMETLDNPATFDIANMGFKYGIGGIDLSYTTDLTAAVLLLRRKDDPNFYIESMFWLPRDKVVERTKEDGVPYDLFMKQGILRASGDTVIDNRDVLLWFAEMKKKYGIIIPYFGYDMYRFDESLKEDFKKQF